jgi:hypothetical protein
VACGLLLGVHIGSRGGGTAGAPVETKDTVVPSPVPSAGTTRVEEDPNDLDAFAVKEPPSGWGESLKYLGSGLILSASIVGSGELIATTTLGAQAGFAIL